MRIPGTSNTTRTRSTLPVVGCSLTPRLRRRLCNTRSSGGQMLSCIAVRSVARVLFGETHGFAGSKYFGGHSDLLCGILVVPTLETWKEVRTVPDDPAWPHALTRSSNSWDTSVHTSAT